MRYKLLGKSGLRVSEICLGAMTFGEEWGWGVNKEESRKVFDYFVNAGGNFIDTANLYTKGTSETYLGEFIAAERERLVIASKYTLSMRPGDVNGSGNHRKNLIQSLEASLKRLRTDYIDLYWLHAWDFMTPIEEVMRALDDMVRMGKILYIGISDTPAWIVSQANMLAALKGWTSFVGLQIEYSLIERTPERELLPMAKALDLAVTPWAVLGSGILTGKYNRDTNEAKRLAKDNPRLKEKNLKIADEVLNIAKEADCSPAHVALNWVRQQKQLIIPIIGARNISQLQDNFKCFDHHLADHHMQRLDDISKIELGFPHEFLTRDYVKKLIYGDHVDLIDNHRA